MNLNRYYIYEINISLKGGHFLFMGTVTSLTIPVKATIEQYELKAVKKGLMLLSGSDVYFMDDLNKRKRVGFEFPSDIIGAGKDTAFKYVGRKIIGQEPIVMKEAVVFTDM